MFRAIGVMGSAALPEIVQVFYSKMAVFTFDFEFAMPGPPQACAYEHAPCPCAFLVTRGPQRVACGGT